MIPLKNLFQKLNLRPHENKGVEVPAAVDVEVHRGADGRIYILDVSRVFPPQDPRKSSKVRSYLFELLRPEFLEWYYCQHGKQFCSDAFSGFMDPEKEDTKEAKEVVIEATKELFESVIPRFTNEIVMIILEETSARRLKEFNLKTAMHSSGINLRHMGKVYKILSEEKMKERHPPAALQNARVIMMIEMFVRAIRTNINAKMRREMEKPKQKSIEEIHLEMLQSLTCAKKKMEEEEVKEFWNETCETVKQKYEVDFTTSFADEKVGKVIFLDRLLELTKCKLDKEFRRHLHENPEEIESMIGKLNLVDIKRNWNLNQRHMNVVFEHKRIHIQVVERSEEKKEC